MRNKIFIHFRRSARKLGILDHLRLENLDRSLGVCLGAMRTGMVTPEIVAHRRRKIARLHTVVYPLYIHVTPLRCAEVPSGTGELLFDARNVKAVCIESGQVAAFEELEYFLCPLTERGAILHDFVRDAVYRCRLGRNRNGGVEKPSLRLLRSVWIELDGRKLNYAVVARIDARRFNVKNYKRNFFSLISGAGGLL